MSRHIWREYYVLTKPGIIRGNVLVAAAGFLFAAQGVISVGLFIATIVGTALIIAAACVCNNYLDRAIDQKMERTQKRALVTGTVSVRHALLFAGILGLTGAVILGLWVNWVVFALGIIAFLFYVVIYGWAKRKSIHGTLVGTIPGAIPPVAGYAAVTGSLDLTAALLFLILVFWQMPHFYAIAIYRLKDYKRAGLPVMPAVKGIAKTKAQMLIYAAAFVLTVPLFYVFANTGYSFTIVMSLVGLYWLYLTAQGFRTQDDVFWAKLVFRFSLIVLLTLSLMLSLDTYLP